MSNTRRLKRGLSRADRGSGHTAVREPKIAHGKSWMAAAGHQHPTPGSEVWAKLHGLGPRKRTMQPVTRSAKHGSKPGRRGSVNRAHRGQR